jgi:hypothetical protein
MKIFWIFFLAFTFVPEKAFPLTYSKKISTDVIFQDGSKDGRTESEGFYGDNFDFFPICKKMNINAKGLRQGLSVFFKSDGSIRSENGIYDCQYGFGKVVFIIRKDFADSFKANFGNKLEGKIEVDYVYQELDAYVGAEFQNPERTKPWGTGHAILCAADAVKEPFAVINADDYYGTDAFAKAAQFLNADCNQNTYAIIGYQLDMTLSEHGTVSRGVCKVNAQQHLVSIKECTKIYKNEEGKVVFEENEQLSEVPADSSVSMNFWCFHPSIFSETKMLFEEFLPKNTANIKSEFFIT